VIRAGFGINYSPPLQDGFDFPYFAGYNGTNPVVARTRGRFREEASYLWDLPYPTFNRSLPNTDPALLNGADIGWYLPRTNRFPYAENWNFGIQYALPWEIKAEANYVGNVARRLKDNYLYSLNQVDPRYLALGDALLDDISLHPEIKKPYPSFEGTVARTLRPFPQYEAVTTHRLNDGFSKYHSLQLTATKRSATGLSFLAAYTFSKALGNADSAIGYGGGYGQNIYNRRADYSVTGFHVPHDFRLTWIYELPFGAGRRWAQTGPARYVLGGWSMSAIHHYRSGAPIAISPGGLDTQALFNPGFYADVLLSGDQQTVSTVGAPDVINGTQYLNPAAFGNPPATANGVPLRLGNAPRFLPDVRGFAQFSEDFSLIKRTALGFREGANFELRMDAINVLNRTRNADPSTDVSDPTTFGRFFGKVNAGPPRIIQLGARVNF
jgi:hypothetical protein